jgi:Bacterial archaeo-eukaryotic release factor family 10
MEVLVESEDLSHAAIRPPATHRRPKGAPSGSGQVPRTPRVAWRPMTPLALRHLASIKDAPGLVVSLYVNLDPTRFALPAARETEVQAVVDAARAEAREVWERLDHDTRQALDGDLERARGYLLTKLAPDGAGAAAVFVSMQRGLFQAFTLDHAVPAQGRAGKQPYLRPLFELAHRPHFAVLAIDRRWAHVLVSRGGGPLHQVDEIESPTRGHHARSGAEQARVQRAVDHDTDQHVKKAAARLLKVHRARPLHALVLACAEEIRPLVERRLHADLRPLLLGRVPWDPEQDHPVDLTRAAEPLLRKRERRQEEAILDRLQLEVGRGTGAVGADAVLDTLNRKAVETLLLETGVETAGAVCLACGWLAAREGECPVCGQVMEMEQDLVEEMLRRALEQSAEVRFLRFVPPHPGEPAHLAAVLRIATP